MDPTHLQAGGSTGQQAARHTSVCPRCVTKKGDHTAVQVYTHCSAVKQTVVRAHKDGRQAAVLAPKPGQCRKRRKRVHVHTPSPLPAHLAHCRPQVVLHLRVFRKVNGHRELPRGDAQHRRGRAEQALVVSEVRRAQRGTHDDELQWVDGAAADRTTAAAAAAAAVGRRCGTAGRLPLLVQLAPQRDQPRQHACVSVRTTIPRETYQTGRNGHEQTTTVHRALNASSFCACSSH